MSPASLALFASLALVASAIQPQHSFLSVEASEPGHYGKGKCPCVGIDNLKGEMSLQFDEHYIKYPIETGASCEKWEDDRHPDCKAGTELHNDVPAWCNQKWCYVDPCNCDIEVLPKQTILGIEYQGSPAYWSYDTCGGKDAFSEGRKDACVNQGSEADCSKLEKCAWDGKQCGGKEAIQTCKDANKLDESIHGMEDCRCIGHAGKDGIAKLHINDTHEVNYPADVGGNCAAWEAAAHPACKQEEKPSWCLQKWCWVDPCTCKTKTPPKATMDANSALQFQGMIAHWSYETCGSVDTWSSDGKNPEYCASQKSDSDCQKLGKCSWTGKACLSKEVAEVCKDQPQQHSGAYQLGSAVAGLVVLGTFAMA